ncbi:MAG: NAD-dependent epimerase/dehydratase family protein [Fulvivirga sp.]|uniref:NAD-dependent epimerase/dehydratase family protein n=1 Tax=Fulvivirga sp. TaxID=1931237 RepID=UPI0032EBE18E
MQTILGAGGSIGIELAKVLPDYTDKIRLVSRNPTKVNETDELFAGSLLNKDEVLNAVEGSDVVYLTAGLKYRINIWKAQWPVIMQNVIEACKTHKSKLVFFDNVYMYDRNELNHMTEKTSVRPSSEKGIVRQQIAKLLMEAVEKGEIQGLIARSADFIGPKNSVPTEIIAKNLMKGKSAQWMASLDKIHSLTDTYDAGKGTAMLGNSNTAYNQVWHLPTDATPLTAQGWVDLFAMELNAKPKCTVLPIWLMGILGLFNGDIKELKEMAYQYDRDYYFDSTKFCQRFEYKPSTPEASVKRVCDCLSNKE